jgi:hypothetical protein
MADPLAGPVRRFNRAKAQLEGLKASEEEFLSREPYSSTTHFDPKRERHVFIAHVREDPDPELGLLAAECIHNLRAGLDNLLWSVADDDLRKRRLYFPIYDDPVLFLCNAYPTLRRLSPQVYDAIEWYQRGC